MIHFKKVQSYQQTLEKERPRIIHETQEIKVNQIDQEQQYKINIHNQDVSKEYVNDFKKIQDNYKLSHFDINRLSKNFNENYQTPILIRQKSLIETTPQNDMALSFIKKDKNNGRGNHFQGQEWINHQEENCNFIKEFPKRKLKPLQYAKKQIIYIQKNASQFKLDEMRRKKKYFQDQNFPPTKLSLCGSQEQKALWKKIKWKKITEIYPQAKIFQGRIQPNDIKQGFLGDCYLLAGIAALAELPDRIIRLFLIKKKNQLNYFSVKLLFKGKWKILDLDENVPVLFKKPAFGTSIKSQELWVLLLEKAWAKLYGSYKQIQAGSAEQSLHDLTGAPIKYVNVKLSREQKYLAQKNWQYLITASKKQYAMVATSNQGSDTKKSQNGINFGHAYTFLNAFYLNTGMEHQKLIQLRNPWGKGEWTGKWCDDDKRWDNISEQQKHRIGYKLDLYDGLFFMPYENFVEQFRQVTAAEVNDNASYVYHSFADKQCKGVYFRIDILFEGKYSFQVDKPPERSYSKDMQKTYKYPEAWLEMGKLVDDHSVKRYRGMKSKRRTLFLNFDLEPGTYIAWVKISYDSKYEKDYQVNLAVYGEYACTISLATHDEAFQFNKNQKVEWYGYNKYILEEYKNLSPVKGVNSEIERQLQQEEQDSIEKAQKEKIIKKASIGNERNIQGKKNKIKKIKRITNIKQTKQMTQIKTKGQQLIKREQIKTEKQQIDFFSKQGKNKMITETISTNKTKQNKLRGEMVSKVTTNQENKQRSYLKADGQVVRKILKKENKLEEYQQQNELSSLLSAISLNTNLRQNKSQETQKTDENIESKSNSDDSQNSETLQELIRSFKNSKYFRDIDKINDSFQEEEEYST